MRTATFAEIIAAMNLAAILLLGVGLSLDSLAASISIGCNAQKTSHAQRVRFVVVVGLLHLLLTVIGWCLGEQLFQLIEHYAHWIASGVLTLLGLNMAYEGLKNRGECTPKTQFLSLSHTLLLCTAVSLDALIAGFSMGLVVVDLGGATPLQNTLLSGAIIGATVSVISAIGLLLGAQSARLLGRYSGVIGGVILLVIALKILCESL